MHVTRRPALDSDRAFVERAMRAAYEELVVRVHGAWDAESIARGFAEKWAAGGFEIVERGGVAIGALWTSDEGDHLRLREVFLLPEEQGRGVGTALVREEIARAHAQGKALRLRALRANRAAALYRRLGLTECGDEGEKVWMEIRPA